MPSSGAHALERGERFFERHGAKTVFLGRFVPGVRVVAAVLAGAGAMPWPRFAVYNLAGAFVWAATVASLASLVGPAVAAGAVDRRGRRRASAPGWWRCCARGAGRRRRHGTSRGSADAAARPLAPAARTARRARERRRTRLVLGGALLLCLGLRLPYIHFPLGIDEGGVAFIAKAWGTGHGSLYGAYWLDRPPLLVALYKLAVAGGATGIRVLGAVAALALVAATTLVRAPSPATAPPASRPC